MRKEEEAALKEMLAKLKKELPDFDSEDTVIRAAEQCEYMWSFPEDYNDGDYDASELTDQMDDLRWGFEALVQALTEILNKKTGDTDEAG